MEPITLLIVLIIGGGSLLGTKKCSDTITDTQNQQPHQFDYTHRPY